MPRAGKIPRTPVGPLGLRVGDGGRGVTNTYNLILCVSRPVGTVAVVAGRGYRASLWGFPARLLRLAPGFSFPISSIRFSVSPVRFLRSGMRGEPARSGKRIGISVVGSGGWRSSAGTAWPRAVRASPRPAVAPGVARGGGLLADHGRWPRVEAVPIGRIGPDFGDLAPCAGGLRRWL